MATDLQRWFEEQPPIHPGEIIDEEFLKPMNVSRLGNGPRAYC